MEEIAEFRTVAEGKGHAVCLVHACVFPASSLVLPNTTKTSTHASRAMYPLIHVHGLCNKQAQSIEKFPAVNLVDN